MSTPNQFSPQSVLGLDVLMTLEVAILRRMAPRDYQVYGMAPYFYTQLFPQETDGSHCHNPWNYSPMLEFFLDDAERVFEKNPDPGARLASGIWIEETESGEEVPLTATALVMKESQVLLIQAVREDYADRVRILRKARAEILERRKVDTALNVYKKKTLYDDLTKLYNRTAFMDIMQAQIANLRTYIPNLALLMLDLDHFNKVNDDLGHLAGDAVLIQTGELLRRSLRKNDAPVRYGGEKFAILAPNTSLAQSLQVAEKMRCLVADYDFGLDRQVTVSIGCTIYRPGEDSRDFIARADQALSDAKRAGRNAARIRDPWSSDLPADGQG